MDSAIAPVEGPSAWTAAAMRADDRWVFRLAEADIAALDAALGTARARGATTETLTAADFPVGGFAARLDAIRREVEAGRGLVLLRGLPVDRYDMDQAQLLFRGLGAHLGETVGQNRMGEMIAQVTDIGRDLNTDHHGRGYQGSGALAYHCDRNDILGLMCWRAAKSGGLSLAASTAAIHNAILERRPELIGALYGPFCIDYRGEEREGEKPYFVQPMFMRHKGRFFARYGKAYVMSAQRFAEVPRLTPEQLEAIALVNDMAASDEFRLEMTMEPGDIQLLNNHVTVHSRTAFEDWPDPARRRRLFRILFLTESFADAPAAYAPVRATSRYWRDHPRPPAEVVPVTA
jgi:hypothetical protein